MAAGGWGWARCVHSRRSHGSLRLLTARCGRGRQTTLAEYGGYEALRKALKMTPAAVIAEIKAAGLVGARRSGLPNRPEVGGGGQGRRRAQIRGLQHGRQSEPGTFKDRFLLMDDPHSILEGMLIAGYAIGAARGYFHVRGEHAYMLPVLGSALAAARKAGLLGGEHPEFRLFRSRSKSVWGRGGLHLRRGDVACSFESIERQAWVSAHHAAVPHHARLASASRRLSVNNVETMCNVPLILKMGAQAYRQIGTEQSTGPKLFCVSGDVARSACTKCRSASPCGNCWRWQTANPAEPPESHTTAHQTTARPDNRIPDFQAILFGGAARTFATTDHLDVRLTFEDLRAAGLTLGSGVVMVFDRSRDLRQVLLRLGRFFAHESCGKCYPCQMGTQRQVEILERLAAGNSLPGDLERLQDVGWTMTDASLCGLGQTTASAVLSAVKLGLVGSG